MTLFNNPDSILWNWKEFKEGGIVLKLIYILLFPFVPLIRYVGFRILGKR